MTQNLEAYDICQKFGPILYDGENVSPEGISYAMDWCGIPKEERSITARKIIAFFREAKATIENKNQKSAWNKEMLEREKIKNTTKGRK